MDQLRRFEINCACSSAQGYIALKRAACLMDQDEVQTNDNHLLPVFGGPAVEIEDGNFNWVGPDKPILKE